jgi:hypothetical protein
VLPEIAEARAATCKSCDQNGDGDWLSYFTVPVSNQIRRQLSQKDGLELETSIDKDLGVCVACSCPLKLKVWTPLAHILNHTQPEVLNNLPGHCWQITEKV